MHIADFPALLQDIKNELKKDDKWNHYGWYEEVLNARDIDFNYVIERIFNIDIIHVYGPYYRPSFKDTYKSMFFKDLVVLTRQYFTNGTIYCEDSENNRYEIHYEDGSIKSVGRA